MERRPITMLGALALSASVLSLAGCSGGGSGTTTTAGAATGITVASKVSVVDANQTTPKVMPGLMGALQTLRGLATVPSDQSVDYNKDKPNVYVNEKAGEAFNTVNMVLCMVDQTKYGDMVNKGFYKAMINTNACQGNDSASNSGSSAQGDTSGSSAPSYDTWTVKSERTDNNSPEILTAFVHMAKGGPSNQPMTVHAIVTIYEGASASNPVGIFTMNYRGFMDANPSGTAMKGILKAEKNANGKVIIKFAEKEFGPGGVVVRNAKAAYEKDDTAKTGQGSASMAENYGNQNPTLTPSTMDFAYSATEFKRVSGGNSVCLDRSKFETSAWRYGVYSSSGARKNVNAGFSINTKQDGSGFYGYLGYYGLNLPPGASIADGGTVYKKVWANGTETTTPYTMFVKGGKLKKHVKKEITLPDIKNIPLEGNDQNGNMFRVIWDGTGLKTIATAQQSMNGPPAWTDVPANQQAMTFNNLQWGELNYYSQALSGQVRIKLNNCQPNVVGQGQQPTFTCDTPNASNAATVKVVFFTESTVLPGDTVPANLACFDNCPSAAAGDVTGSFVQTAKAYTFDSAATGTNNMVLVDNGTALLKTVDGSTSWGFNSGPLFDSALIANPATSPLKCDWNDPQGNPMICGWKAWSALSEFYTWETGKNSWNQFSAAKDAQGNFVKFDPPLQASYIHTQIDSTASDYKYNGTKFFLEYSGFGDLQGIPGKCVNPDTGATVTDCSGNGFRWVPEFTIPADSTVTIGGVEYLVKPLDMEQRMKAKVGGCTTLTTSDYSSQMPNVDDPTQWTNPTSSMPTEPTDSPVKVIGGVVQQ